MDPFDQRKLDKRILEIMLLTFHYTEVETKVRGLEDVTEVTQWHV